ncbi:MAG: hypothetical protein ACRDYU_10375 [Actinomycetes bacterium]
METLRLALLFLHLVGMASLLGGFLVQMSATERRVVPAMVHGALTQLVTGALLVPVRGDAPDVDHAKIAVKGVVLLVILVLVWVNRSRATISEGVYFAIGGLTLLNVGVAVFWT